MPDTPVREDRSVLLSLMAKTITIPEYKLVNLLRHYKALASAEISHSDLRAINAKRVAPKEITQIENIIKNSHGGKEQRP